MQIIRCKFKCIEMGEIVGWGEHKTLFRFKFSAVTGDSAENRQFWAATPSGQMEFQSVNGQAFKVGEDYFLDIGLANEHS